MQHQLIRLHFDTNVTKLDEDCFTVYTSQAVSIADALKHHITCEVDTEAGALRIYGNNLCDVFDLVYKDSDSYKEEHYVYFKNHAYGAVFNALNAFPTFKFRRTRNDAVVPKKNKPSDSGFDLVVVEKIKEANGVSFYDTGIQVAPPIGYYFDLVGRSSISKTGYMMANNIGIIDQTYRGNIIVALVKVWPNAPDLELPCRLVQLIPRKVCHIQCIEVDNLENTSRGAGGFGSSGRV